MKNLEKQISDALFEVAWNDKLLAPVVLDRLKEQIIQECAIVARDYAKRFAEWILDSRFRPDLERGGWERTFSHSEPQRFTTAGLMAKFDKESTFDALKP